MLQIPHIYLGPSVQSSICILISLSNRAYWNVQIHCDSSPISMYEMFAVWQWQCSDETLIHQYIKMQWLVPFLLILIHRSCISNTQFHFAVRLLHLIRMCTNILNTKMEYAAKCTETNGLFAEKDRTSHLHITWMGYITSDSMQIICYLHTNYIQTRDGTGGESQWRRAEKPLHNCYACLLFYFRMFLLSNLWDIPWRKEIYKTDTL